MEPCSKKNVFRAHLQPCQLSFFFLTPRCFPSTPPRILVCQHPAARRCLSDTKTHSQASPVSTCACQDPRVFRVSRDLRMVLCDLASQNNGKGGRFKHFVKKRKVFIQLLPLLLLLLPPLNVSLSSCNAIPPHACRPLFWSENGIRVASVATRMRTPARRERSRCRAEAPAGQGSSRVCR